MLKKIKAPIMDGCFHHYASANFAPLSAPSSTFSAPALEIMYKLFTKYFHEKTIPKSEFPKFSSFDSLKKCTVGKVTT